MAVLAIRNLDCFIIMPFSQAKARGITLDEVKLTYIYENYFCKAIRSYNKNNFKFANVTRYDSSRGNFVKEIIGNLYNAGLVVADLTGLNPNVFYELGIRHTLKNGTILLTQDISSLPADLKNYIAFEYKYPDISEASDYYRIFEEQMHKSIDEFVIDVDKPDNPVKDFLGIKNIIKDEQRKKDILTNIGLMNYIKALYLVTIRSLIITCTKWVDNEDHPSHHVSLGVDPILNRMTNLNESIETIMFLQNLITSQNIINHNQQNIKIKINKEKNIDVAKNVDMNFSNKDEIRYHTLDLMTYYDFTDNNFVIVRQDPILTSFDYFIKQWENELREIDS